MRNSSALSANMAYRNPWNGGESHRPVNTTSGGSNVKVCQFVNHVIACYPNQAGWEVSTQRKERGHEKLNSPTAEVTNPDGGRQSMVEADRSFSVVVNAHLCAAVIAGRLEIGDLGRA